MRLVGIREEESALRYIEDHGLDIQSPVFIAYPAGFIAIPRKKKNRQAKVVSLKDHSAGVLNEVRRITENPLLHHAAIKHDDGKKDFRFQIRLGNHDRTRILAKSGESHGHLPSWLETLPKGWRHEINSLADLPKDTPDLVKYLIATHHGFGRTIMPFWGDSEIWCDSEGKSWGKLTDRLNDEYNPWGLAYLEAVLRLSDWIQSRKEQE